MQQHLLGLRWQCLEGRVDVETVVFGHTFQHREGVGIAPVPALHRARCQAQGRESHHALRVEHRHLAQPAAAGAGADGRVEGKQPRLQLAERIAAHRAAELAGKQVFPRTVHLQRDGPAVGNAQRRLEAFRQALLQVRLHAQAVHHDIDVVLFVLLQLGQFAGLEHLARLAVGADAKAHVALRLHVLEQLDELALAVARHRGQHHQPRVGRQRHRRIDHLADTLRLQRQAVVRAEGRAGAGVEQAQVVVDLGDGADGGARVVAGGLLLDADGRRQALDDIDIGFVHQLQELPRIGGKALDVTPLAFGIQRVEGQAGLARARQPGDHHQRVPGDVQVDVLQVVRARTADADGGRFEGQVGGHGLVRGQPSIISTATFSRLFPGFGFLLAAHSSRSL